jgi:hypothetical protein
MSPSKNIMPSDLDVFLVDTNKGKEVEIASQDYHGTTDRRLRKKALQNHQMWQKDWDRTVEYMNSRRESTGVALIELQDTYKDNPLPESALDSHEIYATFASGFNSD